MGVPVIGCGCAVCMSPDPRNKRLRTSALVEHGDTKLLIDAGPDMRIQVLRAAIGHVDAVLLTHSHADHIGGIDDLRPFSMWTGKSLPLYGDDATLKRVRHMFDYAFDPQPSLSTRPQLELHPLTPRFAIGSIALEPLAVLHGSYPITGYRFGPLAYITDASALPPETMERLTRLDTLVINALRHKPHPLHLTVEQALAIVDELRPRQAYFVHITHDLEHAATNVELPPYAQLAYDGQVIEVSARS